MFAAIDPITMILREPKLLVVIFAGIAWIVKSLSAAQKKLQGSSVPTRSSQDDEQAERTRRVQEEVQRKIAERRMGRPLARPDVAPRPISTPFSGRAFEPPLTDVSPPDFDEETLTRQKKLQDQVRALDAARKSAAAAAAAFAAPVAANVTTVSGTPQPSENWASEIRAPGGARRAMVLREILGSPIALR